MLRDAHTEIYASEPEALRSFIRDKLRFPSTDGRKPLRDHHYGGFS